jgi:hypothetical protein
MGFTGYYPKIKKQGRIKPLMAKEKCRSICPPG